MFKSKNKISYFFTSFFLFTSFLFSQVIQTNDNQFNIEITTARKLSKIQYKTSVILKSDELNTIIIKMKISSIDGKEKIFDINKFILLDTINNLKIRPIDILYFQTLTKKPHSINPKYTTMAYEPSIPDSFEEYDFDSFETLEFPRNFGTNRKPNPYIIYYRPQEFKSKKTALFFPLPITSNYATLYYGAQKIIDLKFK